METLVVMCVIACDMHHLSVIKEGVFVVCVHCTYVPSIQAKGSALCYMVSFTTATGLSLAIWCRLGCGRQRMTNMCASVFWMADISEL